MVSSNLIRRAAAGTCLVFFLSAALAALAQDGGAPGNEIERENDPQRLLMAIFEAQKAGDLSAMEKAATRLVRLRPQVGTYGYLLAKAFALQNKKSEAYNTLLILNNQGLSFDLTVDEDMANVRGTEVYDFLVDGLAKNAQTEGEVAGTQTLQQKGLLADGLAYDPKRGQLLVGSITEGAVYLIGDGGKLEKLVEATPENGLLGVFDIAVEPDSRSLWVTSAAAPHYRKIRFQDAGYSGIFQFDLDSGQIRRRFDLPKRDPRNKLVNLTVASDGKVYAANAGRPEVYQVDVKREQMTRIFTAPRFTSVRGIAVSPDAGTLYFSDYELGLFGVDLKTQQAFQVRAPAQVNLGGIDGLSWHRDGLVAIQNGNFPHRALRVSLNPEGNAIVGAAPLLVNHPTFLVPSEGIVVGDSFHLLANGNAPLYDNATGKVINSEAMKPQTIVTVNANVEMAPIKTTKAL